MKKTIIYRYLGTNGVFETPIHIENAYYVRLIDLKADEGKILTNGKRKTYFTRVPEEEVPNWYEVIDDQTE